MTYPSLILLPSLWCLVSLHFTVHMCSDLQVDIVVCLCGTVFIERVGVSFALYFSLLFLLCSFCLTQCLCCCYQSRNSWGFCRWIQTPFHLHISCQAETHSQT